MDTLPRREREKQVREEEIVLAAEKVFLHKGFDNASMDEIAAAAQFTKRTLYQYFANKEDLYFATVLRGFKNLLEYIQKAAVSEQTGFMKIYQSSIGYYQFYQDFPETLRLINYLGHVKKNSKEISQRQTELSEFDNQLFELVSKYIGEGIADGSIRAHLDPIKTSFSLIFMLTGYFNQLSFTGETFLENFKLDQKDFCVYSMDLLLGSIKN